MSVLVIIFAVEWGVLPPMGMGKASTEARVKILNKAAEIAAQSMLAMAHLMWGGVWFGIAADAIARAQASDAEFDTISKYLAASFPPK